MNEIVKIAFSPIILILIAFGLSKLCTYFGFYLVAPVMYIVIFVFGLLGFLIYNYRKKGLDLGSFIYSFLSLLIMTTIYFAIMYTIPASKLGYITIDGVSKTLNFMEGLYFSILTLTGIGAENFLPYGFFSTYYVIESIMGFISLGLFISALSLILNKTGNNPDKP